MIYNLQGTDLFYKKVSPWWKLWGKVWELQRDSVLYFETEDYSFTLELTAGFRSDGRSGPVFINPFAPKWADHWYNWAITFHDAGYNDKDGLGIEFNELQDIFEAILEYSEHKDKARIMSAFTQRFSYSDWTNVDEFDKENQVFIKYELKYK